MGTTVNNNLFARDYGLKAVGNPSCCILYYFITKIVSGNRDKTSNIDQQIQDNIFLVRF